MYRVGVVGCGVAGATAAYLLARDGHQVTLLERASKLGPIGAGILLQCSGQAVLGHLGILDRVLEHAAPLVELYARHRSGGTLIRTRFAEFAPGTRSYGVHRGVLFNALYALVQTQPIEIRAACEIVGREENAQEVVLTDALGRQHGPFDFVVAADGSKSRLRSVSGFKTSLTEYEHGTLWLNSPGDGVALTNPLNKESARMIPKPEKRPGCSRLSSETESYSDCSRWVMEWSVSTGDCRSGSSRRSRAGGLMFSSERL